MPPGEKQPGAFLTIGEVSKELGVAQHILRYWETKFPQLKPLQRAGNRRYYRPADVDLVRRIDRLLNREGYTMRGVQKLLASGEPDASPPPAPPPAFKSDTFPLERLKDIRARLQDALDDQDTGNPRVFMS